MIITSLQTLFTYIVKIIFFSMFLFFSPEIFT